MITRENIHARYSELTTTRLYNLAKEGVACLRITEGAIAEVQEDSLDNARNMWARRKIDNNNYRRRLRMVLNHCRMKVEEAWGRSPEKKPSVTGFLAKCRNLED